MTDGKKANKRGTSLESWTMDLLLDTYEQVSPKHFFALTELKQPIFAHQCTTGKDIYGKKRRVDFILYHPLRWKDCLVIQCKWQASRGSVEEKYPFEVLSIQTTSIPTIIVLDGGGYSKGAKDWLMGQAGKTKLLHIFSIGELQRFASKGIL